jgi:hypothetical protein
MVLGLHKTYNEELQKRLSESLEDVTNFNDQLLGLEEWSPSDKDGMGNLKDASIDLWISLGELANKILLWVS